MELTLPILHEQSGWTHGKRWAIFCEILLTEGYALSIDFSESTDTKYITVKKHGYSWFKVRVSDHRPSLAHNYDFNFSHAKTMEMALDAVHKHFGR